ncbi:MAG: cytochrome C [SAR86 cluster bacterium]|uniref:Cytochrome C n=1 Tax=SAR86 cluster bacterium TaxID=2030880 RepID=A0A2A4WX88_9GAMM|nr:MAG: cytochrome C [SAR86 cluster bacterium]
MTRLSHSKAKLILIAAALVLLSIALILFQPPSVSSSVQLSDSPEAIERGEYLVIAGGCISCHRGEEDAESFIGGLALETDFGTFFAPNITPDMETGLGNWQAKDFLLALKHGRTPSGSFYYPAFPYRAYGGLSDQDAVDIGSYLMSLEPINNSVSSAQTPAWLNRWAMAGWNLLADMNEVEFEAFDDELVERGAYLARNLGHCSECHTPRNAVGILDANREFAGATLGEDVIEAIDAAALEEWTATDLDLFLLLGLKPDGDFAGGDMNDVIEHNTSKISDEDRAALAAFFTRHNQPE